MKMISIDNQMDGNNYDYIFEYVRDRHNNRVGVILALKNKSDNTVTFGWSLCKKSDQFSRDVGIGIAINRALKFDRHPLLRIPHSMKQHFETFRKRAGKYFKNSFLVEN